MDKRASQRSELEAQNVPVTQDSKASRVAQRYVPTSTRLMDQVREALKYYGYARSTRDTYESWVRAYVRFHLPKHPRDLNVAEIESYLNHLVHNRKVATSTQQQAMHAVLFLYKRVLGVELERRIGAARSTRKVRVPVVMSVAEVQRLLQALQGQARLMAELMYGSGLRVQELCRLRVKDVDFDGQRLLVYAGKGDKDRVTLLPASVHSRLREQIERVAEVHNRDLAKGHGEVHLPMALARKYPNAGKQLAWQYLFPARTLSPDPEDGVVRRHHIDASALRKKVTEARRAVGIHKRVTPHTFRHSFATELLRNGTNIRVVQELMGHADVSTTEIYTHVLAGELNRVVSPLERVGSLDS